MPPYLQQTLKPHHQRGWVEYLGEGGYIATFSYCWCSSEAPPQTRRLWLLDASLCTSASGRSVGLSVCLWQELSDSSGLQFECLYKPQTIYKSAREALNCLSVVEQRNVIRYYGYFTYICMLLPYKSSGSWSPTERENGCHWGRDEIRLHAWNTACTFVLKTRMGPANHNSFAVI